MNRIYLIGAITLCAWLMLPLSSFSEDAKTKIVVFNLEAKSAEITQDEVLTLSDYLRDAFISTKKFDVVSRTELNKISDEKKLQLSGFTSESNVIELSKIFSVKKAIVGSAGKFGEKYIISLKLFDLETAKYIAAESIQAENKNDLLEEMETRVEDLAERFNGENLSAEPIVPSPKKSPLKPVLNITGYSLIGVSVVSGILGFVFDGMAQTSYKNANAAYTDYTTATTDFDAKWSTYQGFVTSTSQNLSYRNISYITGGVALGLGLVCVLTPLFLPGENVSVTVTPAQLSFCYKF